MSPTPHQHLERPLQITLNFGEMLDDVLNCEGTLSRHNLSHEINSNHMDNASLQIHNLLILNTFYSFSGLKTWFKWVHFILLHPKDFKLAPSYL